MRMRVDITENETKNDHVDLMDLIVQKDMGITVDKTVATIAGDPIDEVVMRNLHAVDNVTVAEKEDLVLVGETTVAEVLAHISDHLDPSDIEGHSGADLLDLQIILDHEAMDHIVARSDQWAVQIVQTVDAAAQTIELRTPKTNQETKPNEDVEGEIDATA